MFGQSLPSRKSGLWSVPMGSFTKAINRTTVRSIGLYGVPFRLLCWIPFFKVANDAVHGGGGVLFVALLFCLLMGWGSVRIFGLSSLFGYFIFFRVVVCCGLAPSFALGAARDAFLRKKVLADLRALTKASRSSMSKC